MDNIENTATVNYVCAPNVFNAIRIIYPRYPQAIEMSADNQAALEYPPDMAPKIPHLVYQQLSTDFLPAAKAVGQAGIHLHKAYNQLQDALSFYCDATHKLIKSADSAGPNSRNEAAELTVVFKEFVKGVKSHQKIIADFETLALKVHEYSSKDKEKMKAEYNDFRKMEKKMQKRKHGETDKDIKEFYRKEAANWSRQQELRYKFFNEKLHNWIQGYSEIVKSLECFKISNEQLSSGEVESDHHHQHHLQNGVVEEGEDQNSDWHGELHDLAATVAAAEEDHKTADNKVITQHVEAPAEPPRAYSTTESSVATTLDDLPSAPRLTSDGVRLVSNHKRKSIDIMLPPPTVVRNQTPPRDYRIAAPPAVVQLPAPPPAAPVPAPRFEEARQQADYRLQHRTSTLNSAPEPPRATTPGRRQFAGAVPVLGYRHDPQPHITYTPQQNGISQYRPIVGDRIQLGRVVESPPTAEQLNKKKYHVESTYVAAASPSHQPTHSAHPSRRHEEELDVSVPSYFTPSQYGRTLTVNDDFNASSGEQMTVNRGDKVILLKCGSRGWLFVRDSVSNRTGWVPEPYVNP